MAQAPNTLPSALPLTQPGNAAPGSQSLTATALPSSPYVVPQNQPAGDIPSLVMPQPVLNSAMQQGAQTYGSLYTGNLSYLANGPVPGLGEQVDLSALDQLTAQVNAARASSPGLNGVQADPNSKVLKGASDHTLQDYLPKDLGQVAWKVGGNLYQSTIGDYLDSWAKGDWKTALAETGLAAVAIGGTILAPEIAVPALFALGAVTQLPSTLKAMGDEISNPSDSNLVAAVTGAANIALLGSPVKAFRTLRSARSGLQILQDIRSTAAGMKDIHTVLSGERGALRGLNVESDPRRQTLLLPTSLKDLQGLVTQGRLDPKQVEVDNLLSETKLFEKAGMNLRKAEAEAKFNPSQQANSDLEAAQREMAALKDPRAGTWNRARVQVAQTFGFHLDQDHLHVPLDLPQKAIDAIGKDAHQKAEQAMRGIGAVMSEMSKGNGLSLPHELDQAIEGVGVNHMSGNATDNITLMKTWMRNAWSALGFEPDEASFAKDSEKIFKALEDKATYDSLTPKEEAAAHYMARFLNIMSQSRARTGLLPLMQSLWIPMTKDYVTAADGSEMRVKDVVGMLSNPRISYEAKWKFVMQQDQLGLTDPTSGRVTKFRKRHEVLDDIEKGVQRYVKQSKSNPHRAMWRQLTEAEQGELRQLSQSYGRKGGRPLAGQPTGKLAGAHKDLKNFQDELQKRLRGMSPATAATDARVIQLKRFIGNRQATITRLQQELKDIEDQVQQKFGPLALDMVQSSTDRFGKIIKTAPKHPVQNLLQGWDLIDHTIARTAYALQENQMRDSLLARVAPMTADLMSRPEAAYERGGSAAARALEGSVAGEMPAGLTSEAFHGGAGGVEAEAQRLGYAQALPAIGTPKDPHYRPAIWLYTGPTSTGRLAASVIEQLRSGSMIDVNNAVLSFTNRAVGAAKSAMFFWPAIHYLNVTGRMIGMVLAEPAMAGGVLKQVAEMVKSGDRSAYYRLRTEAGIHGMVPANRHDHTQQLDRLMKEGSGQPAFPWVQRLPGGQFLGHVYSKYFHDALWDNVDHLQMAAYIIAKDRMTASLGAAADEKQVGMLAAQYANNIAGQVNPIYMSKIYRQIRNLVWLAPSYQATFARQVWGSLPGASKLSEFLARSAGGKFVRFGSIPLKAIDLRHRKELTRLTRSWTVNYMAAALTSADLLNQMFSGHHIWDNEEGHKFEIDVSDVLPPVQSGASTKRTYVATIPAFSQAGDVVKALGLGHDWGWEHMMQTPQWQAADAWHKASLLGGAALEGARRVGAAKLSPAPQAAYQAVTGESLFSRLGEGVNQKADRWEALASFLPGAFLADRVNNEYGQIAALYPPGSAQEKQALDQAKQNWLFQLGSTAATQITGLPSLYHQGVEKPPIDDNLYVNWQNGRNTRHTQLNSASQAMISGAMAPQDYYNLKHTLSIQQVQSDADTFGDSTPSGRVAQLQQRLIAQFKPTQVGISADEQQRRWDSYDTALTQNLQSLPEADKQAYWDAHTSQWTDADYLYWEAQQIRQGIMDQVDGQGGNHIRQVEMTATQLRTLGLTADATALEANDPQYQAYKAALSVMAKDSVIGAFVNAFTSSYANVHVVPGTLPPDVKALLAEQGSGTYLSSEEVAQSAQEAKSLAQQSDVAQSAGQNVPELQDESQAAVQLGQEGG